MPAEWDNLPRVYRLVPHWEDNLAIDATTFRLDYTSVTAPPSLYGEVASDHVIFIDTRSGEMVRRDQPLPVKDQYYDLKQVGEAVLPQLSPGLLYSLLVQDVGNP
jgi:hypothetical protein